MTGLAAPLIAVALQVTELAALPIVLISTIVWIFSARAASVGATIARRARAMTYYEIYAFFVSPPVALAVGHGMNRIATNPKPRW